MSRHSFIVHGKLALPYQYFAGSLGSKFIRALRDEKRIFGTKCSKCNTVYVPPRSLCDRCFLDIRDNIQDVSNEGTVITYTVVNHYEDHYPCKPPFILGLIKLDGATTPMVHIIKDVPIDKMRSNVRVRAVFSKYPQNTILNISHFEPIDYSVFERGYTYEELEIGMSASFTKTITETDVYLFAGISGDFNPMHVNEEYAKHAIFGKRVAHGAVPQSLIAPVLGTKLPGLGTVAIEINTRFKRPTYFGDTITAIATVKEKIEDKKWVKMDLRFINQRGEIIAKGEAVVMPPKG